MLLDALSHKDSWLEAPFLDCLDGLSSEVRSVSQLALRINEADRLGFKACIVPKNNLKMKLDLKRKNIKVVGVETVKEAIEALT